ncbi:MAG TPA: hypothetical protein VIM00_06595 [Candidatus Acidoferrum sp.]|jgi:hypothetical protein
MQGTVRYLYLVLHGILSLALLFPYSICAQEEPKPDINATPMAGMEQMAPPDGSKGEMSGMDGKHMHPRNFIEEIEHHSTSGTSAEPNSTPTPMWMTEKRQWQLMFHANVFVSELQQSGPRGADRFFSTNWFMGMAQHKAGPGTFTARLMLSLEPATVTNRRYPLLFQQGETAFGLPIVDGQHPHDFVMELAALYDLKLGEKSLLSFYFAPMGDPALGPTAYPHRTSAMENPVGTLGHHQEDSTHIADDVVTVGFTHRMARLEISGFHGREPDEFRWDVDSGKIDSWSTRLTVQAGKNWSGQYSYGRLVSPEALFANEDQERMTASAMYNRPLHEGNWTSTVLWGRTRSLRDNSLFNSYLLESTVRFATRNYAWTRIENADRSNELLLGRTPLPVGFTEERIGRVQAYSFGYSHDFDLIPHVASALGAQITTYGVPKVLRPFYDAHPVGGMVFLRFRPYAGSER